MNKPFEHLLAGTSPPKSLKKDMHEVSRPTKFRKPHRHYEKDPYTQEQNLLYNRALFGLSVYSRDEIKMMHFAKRDRIKARHLKVQNSINRWKQEIIIQLTDHLFKTVFPDSPFTKEIVYCPECRFIDDDYICRLSFKTLKITKPMIVDRLIKEGMLPWDFKTLNKL